MGNHRASGSKYTQRERPLQFAVGGGFPGDRRSVGSAMKPRWTSDNQIKESKEKQLNKLQDRWERQGAFFHFRASQQSPQAIGHCPSCSGSSVRGRVPMALGVPWAAVCFAAGRCLCPLPTPQWTFLSISPRNTVQGFSLSWETGGPRQNLASQPDIWLQGTTLSSSGHSHLNLPFLIFKMEIRKIIWP